MTERVGVMALVAEARAGIEEISAEEAMPLVDLERSFWSTSVTSGSGSGTASSRSFHCPRYARVLDRPGEPVLQGDLRLRQTLRLPLRPTGARSCRRTPPGVWGWPRRKPQRRAEGLAGASGPVEMPPPRDEADKKA